VDSDVDRQSVDPALVVDHKITFAVADNVDDAADFPLQLVEASLPWVKINYAILFRSRRSERRPFRRTKITFR
jgi:hypothetical protein